MWKKMMTCNGVNAKTDSMKTMFETCKKENTPEENGSGEKGEGGHGKKHHMWKVQLLLYFHPIRLHFWL